MSERLSANKSMSCRYTNVSFTLSRKWTGTYHRLARLKHQIRIVSPQFDLLLRRGDAWLCFLEQRLGHLDHLRDALVVLVSFFTGFHDALQQELISCKTWDWSVHEVFHIEAVGVWVPSATLRITGKRTCVINVDRGRQRTSTKSLNVGLFAISSTIRYS